MVVKAGPIHTFVASLRPVMLEATITIDVVVLHPCPDLLGLH